MEPGPNGELIGECIALLRKYVSDRGTHRLKALAPLVVELRSRHQLRNGGRDWSGRTSGYREEIRWVYSSAGIPDEELDTVQAALRYHVGNLLRERAPEDELQESGLLVSSPKERLAEQRRGSAWRRRCTCTCRCGAREGEFIEEPGPSLWS